MDSLNDFIYCEQEMEMSNVRSLDGFNLETGNFEKKFMKGAVHF